MQSQINAVKQTVTEVVGIVMYMHILLLKTFKNDFKALSRAMKEENTLTHKGEHMISTSEDIHKQA